MANKKKAAKAARCKATQPKPFVSRKQFKDLMLAAYNIGPGVEAGDKRAAAVMDGVAYAFNMLYGLLELHEVRPGFTDGVMLVVRLMVEVSCAEDPEAYVDREIVRGNEGIRHEDENAGIVLPPVMSMPG